MIKGGKQTYSRKEFTLYFYINVYQKAENFTESLETKLWVINIGDKKKLSVILALTFIFIFIFFNIEQQNKNGK